MYAQSINKTRSSQMTTLATRIQRPAAGTMALWTAQIFSAAMFLTAGISKLAGAPVMVQMFAAIGLGQWFRYLTGSIEVVAALLLFVPSLSFAAALALVTTM